MTSVRRAVLEELDAPSRTVGGGAAQATRPAPGGIELDDAALENIFKRYGVLIHRWAARIFRDGSTADDVLHEVMLRLLSKGASFLALEGEAQRRAWLHRTTLRICWDIKARSKRELGRAEAAATLGATERNAAFEERNLLDGLFQRLDVEERILAVLYFEEGYTKVEIHELTTRSRPFIDKKLDRITGQLQRLEERGS